VTGVTTVGLVLRSGWADGAGSVAGAPGQGDTNDAYRCRAGTLEGTHGGRECTRGVMLVIDRVAMMLRGQVLVLVMGWCGCECWSCWY
jgi:hypothetical protein